MNERSLYHGAEEANKGEAARSAASQQSGKSKTWVHFVASFLASLVAKTLNADWFRAVWEWIKEWWHEWS
jgi:hypothetical protein